MPQLDELRRELNAARERCAEARRSAYRASQGARRLELSLESSKRRLSADQRNEIEALDARLETARADATANWDRLAQLGAFESELLGRFAPQLDPRESIGALDDSTPILMVPLRLETRFKPVVGGGTELWVRVFPDEWAADAFEADLSEQEIASAQLFWAQHWAAGRLRDERLGAWRNLVASHGEGRAAWTVQEYKPAGPEPPEKAPGDVILVVSGVTLPPESSHAAAAIYWESLWRSPDDLAAHEAAHQALVAGVGSETAAEVVTAQPPFNLETALPVAPKTRADTPVSVAWLELPDPAARDVKTASWTQAARTDLLPERLVLVLRRGGESRSVLGAPIPSTVTLGLDPSAPGAESLRAEDGSLRPPEPIAWMFDFDAAVAMGLGFRVPLTPAEAAGGFDRVLVAGVGLRREAADSSTELENLIGHHHFSNTGFSLLPQGTPTNNTGDDAAGYSQADDPEASYDRAVEGLLPDLDETDPLQKLDGQWLAEYLGISVDPVRPVAHADGRDQCESRAMSAALWPATIGYTLDTLLAGVLDEQTLERTRDLFVRFSSARGFVPAIRIGEQPYGILPTTAWSKIAWTAPRGNDVVGRRSERLSFRGSNFLHEYYQVLRKIDADWDDMVADVAHVASPGDLHQVLLDSLGLAPNSLEFYRRNADSLDQMYNLLNYGGLGGALIAWIAVDAHLISGLSLLRKLGWKGDETPEILELFFHQGQEPIADLLVDDVELSEEDPVRVYTDDGRNYLKWLADAARDSLDTLRAQTGFTDDVRPRALLYQLLRHSLQLSYWDTGLRLHAAAPDPMLSSEELRLARAEPKFVHVEVEKSTSESRYFHLYQAAEPVTGSRETLLADHIVAVLADSAEAQRFREVLDGVDHLIDTPTARLERLLIEHLDQCTYRFDAWKQALTNVQMTLMRYGTALEGEARRGIHIGAYGWLEDLRPRDTVPQPADVPAELAGAFDAAARPLLDDPENQGYLHAPSLNQATSAAVLRSAYLSDANEDEPDSLAVNLSSWRVRQALAVLEGMRNDQSLGALLGYRFERELHDNHQLAETDEFIHALRAHFSLVANKLAETEETIDTDGSIASVEARNVVDGLALSEHIAKDPANATYPFGLTDLPTADAAQQAKINAAADNLRNVHDATADLALAEAVHQAIHGNMDAAGATLDAFGTASFPPLAELIDTPREGIGLTLRSALFLDPAPPAGSPWPGVALTPRAEAEPVLNHWVASLLPPPGDLVVEVERTDTNATDTVTAEEVGLQPLDLLYAVRLGDRSRATFLDNRIESVARQKLAGLWAHDAVEIHYSSEAPAGKLSLFEVAPLLESARRLVTGGQPLKASDLALALEANSELDATQALDRDRLVDARASLAALQGDLAAFQGPIDVELADETANRAALIAAASGRLDGYSDLARRAAQLQLVEGEPGLATRFRAGFFRSLVGRIEARIAAWGDRIDEFHGQLARFDAMPASAPTSARYRPLQRAERQVTTHVTAPLPDDPAVMRADLLTALAAFETRRGELETVAQTVVSDPAALLTGLAAVLPLSTFDAEEFPVTDEEDSLVAVSHEMVRSTTGLTEALTERLAAVDTALAEHDAAAGAATRVAALTRGLKAALGEEFLALPTFTVAGDQATELALAHGQSDHILRHLRDDLGHSFPLDDWLVSVGRVRSRMADFEHLATTAEMLTAAELPLTAWQLPHQVDDYWLGAAYPEGHEITSDRLLVTAHHAKPFDASVPQVGILLDEWTEVAPTPSMTTGVAFHLDQPNSEPPQCMLLLLPTDFRGGWLWSDVVDALEETLEDARQRAVAPEQIDRTAYALFLPATLAAATFHPLTIGMTYARVNGMTLPEE